MKVVDCLFHAFDHAHGAVLHGVEGQGHFADFVRGVYMGPLTKIAGSLNRHHGFFQAVNVPFNKGDQQLRAGHFKYHQHGDDQGKASGGFAENGGKGLAR